MNNQDMNYDLDNYDVPVVTDKKVTGKEKYQHLPTKSAQIRAAYADGMTRYQIAQMLGIRYQHVRNVLITPVKTPRS